MNGLSIDLQLGGPPCDWCNPGWHRLLVADAWLEGRMLTLDLDARGSEWACSATFLQLVTVIKVYYSEQKY